MDNTETERLAQEMNDFGPARELYPRGFLQGRSILITGFEPGVIAFTVARFMIEHGGARVCLHGRSNEVLQQGLELLGHQPAHVVAADFSNPDSIEPMLESIKEAFDDPVDTFVHVAGMTAYAPIVELDAEFRTRLRSINIDSAERICAGLLPGMRERGRGWICLFSSIQAAFPHEGNLTYRQTKKDVELLAQNLAYEHGPEGINANAVAPGWVVVNRHFDEAHYSSMLAARDETIPSRRLGYPIDLAMAVSWLCSEAARCVNGVTLPIDGGLHLVLA